MTASDLVSEFAEQFNSYDPRPETIEYIWKRLLTSPSADVRKTSHPRPFVLAVLYMLHIERFSSERPTGDNGLAGEVKGKRREILKRYDVWVPCICRTKCQNEWNFASDRGTYRSISGGISKCKIAPLVEDSSLLLDPEPLTWEQSKGIQKWSSMLESWKQRPA